MDETSLAIFFQNQGTFLWILKKGKGDLPLPPPLTPSSYAPELVTSE